MKNPARGPGYLNRRQFLKASSAVAGAMLLRPLVWGETNAVAPAATVKRTAVDQVTLGKTGIKLSRLGFGTGSGNGEVQIADGKDAFVNLVHYAYDLGITYIDTSEHYHTFQWIADATKGLPREKLFIQSKVDGWPKDVLAVIDSHRKTLNTDYVDSLLVHCMTSGRWTDQWKRVMDAFNVAQERKWIRARGVSCHTLPALRAAVASDWPEVHLVRVNPQGSYVDGEEDVWGEGSNDVEPVMRQIKNLHAKGRGVIGMKICGNGTFTRPADREKSIRYAMSRREIDAVVIGFKNRQEIDEAIERINRALAEV
jgi:predicted aldo/keto reductase-like oxidoreductase